MKKSFTFKHTVFACYAGYITQAIVNNLAPLLFVIFREELGLPLSKITLLVTINFLIQLCVDCLSAMFVDKIGYRKCIVAAHIFASLGLASMAVLPMLLDPFAGLLISVALYAIGGGLIEVLISPIVEACPTDNKASVMALLHSFYCWGTVAVIIVSTLLLNFVSWQALAALWALFPLVNSVFFTLVPIASLTEDGEGMKTRELAKSPMFWVFVVLMLASGASEQAMSQWASAFAELGLGVSKTVGDLMGPCMFSILMGLARVIYSKISEKDVELVNYIIGSGFLCICAYMLASFAASPVLSLVGCAVCGFSVGILWPGVFSIAAAGFPKGGTAMFAYLALAGDLGCSSGPTLVGFVSGLLGDDLKSGVAVGCVFPILLVAFAFIYKLKFSKREN